MMNLKYVWKKYNIDLNYLFKTFSEKNFQLRKKKGMACEREIKQFHYTSWPDHGVTFVYLK